jgi:hypothetical protein
VELSVIQSGEERRAYQMQKAEHQRTMGEEIIRTRFPKQKDFVRFVLRRDWAEVHRVPLKDNATRLPAAMLIAWCDAHLSDRWARSEGNEVYYFERLADATLFRLRWTGMVPDISATQQKEPNHV